MKWGAVPVCTGPTVKIIWTFIWHKVATYLRAYSEPYQTFKMERFAKIVNRFYSLTISTKYSYLDVSQGLYTSPHVFTRIRARHCSYWLILRSIIKEWRNKYDYHLTQRNLYDIWNLSFLPQPEVPIEVRSQLFSWRSLNLSIIGQNISIDYWCFSWIIGLEWLYNIDAKGEAVEQSFLQKTCSEILFKIQRKHLWWRTFWVKLQV